MELIIPIILLALAGCIVAFLQRRKGTNVVEVHDASGFPPEGQLWLDGELMDFRRETTHSIATRPYDWSRRTPMVLR